MIEKISTKNMSREEWLKERKKHIGGSDAGVVLGFNKYKSPFALWTEKTGAITEDDISDKEAVRLGNDLEEYVAKRFTEATGNKVKKLNAILINTDYPFAHANIDRQVVGKKEGLECKTTSSWEILTQCRNGEFPKTWYAQIVHYMAVTGYERWHLAVLVLGKGFYTFVIERNEKEIEALMSAEKAFWHHVQQGTSPEVDGMDATTEAINTLYKDSDDGTSVDLSPMSAYLEMLHQYTKKIDDLKEKREGCINYIKDYMKTCETGDFGDYRVTWKTQERKTLDRKSIEAVYGKLDDKFYKTSKSRPFKFSKEED